MYAVVFFLFLWVLFQVVSVDARCSVDYPDPYVLYIFRTENNDDQKINRLLIHELNSRFFNEMIIPPYYFYDNMESRDASLYDITHYEVLDNCSPYLMEVIEDSKYLRYMIHLGITDFYNNNYNDVNKLLYAWSGNIDNCTNAFIYNETCSLQRKNEKVKIVSQAITSIPSLYNLTLHLPEKDYLTSFTILVCSKDYITNISSYTTFSYFDSASIKITFKRRDCKEKTRFGKNTILIIAPNPSYVEVTDKPVVFYDEAYTVPKTAELYDNRVIQVTSRKKLARAVLELMKVKKWSRIAVLSDDSEGSNDVEQELRILFSKNDISHVMMTAKKIKQHYDFSEALATLKYYDARIILANMDERQVDTLAHQAAEHELISKHKVLWLVPGWSNTATVKAALKLGTVLNFLPKKTELDDVLLSIRNLTQMKRFQHYYDYQNYKIFAQDIASYLPRDNGIDVFETLYQSKRVSTFLVATITTNNVIMKARFITLKDRQDDCFIKSQNYYKPCDDMVLMYIMLVILVFAVTTLGITYFFQTSFTPYRRM